MMIDEARRVGKSYIAEKFAKAELKTLLRRCFAIGGHGYISIPVPIVGIGKTT